MPSIYDLKPRFQNLLRPAMLRLRDAGVTPNMITAVAIALSAATGLVILKARCCPAFWLLVPVALFLRMALNALDGMMAREHGLSSALGMVLNELGDVVSDTIIFLPLACHTGGRPWPVILFAILAIMAEFVGVLAVPLCGQRRYDGPMGKSDRAFAVGLLAILLYVRPRFIRHTTIYFSLLSCLLVISIWNRVRSALTIPPTPPGP